MNIRCTSGIILNQSTLPPYSDMVILYIKKSKKLKLQQTVIAVVVYNNLHTKNTALCYRRKTL